MNGLYIDTTSHLDIGLLDSKLNWLGRREFKEKRNSSHLHLMIYELLNENELSLAEIQDVYALAGPGSYTGIRLAKSIYDILSWQNINVFTFYHFEIPAVLGIKSGVWVCPAFKMEYFIYCWDSNKQTKQLVSREDFHRILADIDAKEIYTNFDFDSGLETKLIKTADLIQSNTSKIFSSFKKEKMQRESFYFRSLEQEFTKGKK